ncbi:hypothetical protein IFM89_012536 [Coptis chinensis]|uniref:Ubiquitinyl hydrolase 1 n=1 Tax=Coptis chinensis TaxID=261450 RepID=A0A835HM07_9MAGN|nr:hypothetical protein IFM89_012536 [Coptis chinensis]
MEARAKRPAWRYPTKTFTWTIKNFSKVYTRKHYSDVFETSGCKWQVLIYPKGCNGVCNGDHLSVYLVVASPEYLPHIWSRYAEFSLSVVNQMYQQSTLRKDAQHKFNRRESNWGFTSFIPLCKLHDPKEGFLVNGTLIIEAEVADGMVVDYDSKMKTGYVGLKNQGATSYINSLLQTLIIYLTSGRLVPAVYRMPMKEKDMQSRSIILALQNLFFKLQYSDESVATKELIQSFGREIYDSSMQHDVQELNRVLCEKIEDKMKRKESFYDLQLDVKDCQDVYASFDKYIKVECLEGDNKYRTGRNGLQDAMKGILFLDFPPVLQLQLKRFEYDYAQNTVVKNLTLTKRTASIYRQIVIGESAIFIRCTVGCCIIIPGSGRARPCDRSTKRVCVLVHNGGEHGGRYYAFIRPNLSHQWLKFDDELVTKEDIIRALEEQYGGEEELPQTNGFNSTPFKLTKYSNAYMLVYIRKSDIEKVICNADVQDIVKPVRGNVAKEFGIPVKFQRFWLWTKRQNLTYRPHRQLTPEEETQSGPTRGPASPLESSSSRWSYKPAQVGYNGWDVPSNSETQQSIPSTCVICLDATIEGACIPCGHLSGCMSCLNEIQGKKWGFPVCRAKIKQMKFKRLLLRYLSSFYDSIATCKVLLDDVLPEMASFHRNWRLLIFPKGNNVKFLSVYLDGADSANLPYGWSRFAEFDLSVVNQMNGRDTAKMFVMSSPLSFSQIEKSVYVCISSTSILVVCYDFSKNVNNYKGLHPKHFFITFAPRKVENLAGSIQEL